MLSWYLLTRPLRAGGQGSSTRDEIIPSPPVLGAMLNFEVLNSSFEFFLRLHSMDKFCKVPGSIKLVVSPPLISQPRRGEAFEAFIAPENCFPPFLHFSFPRCVSRIWSFCNLRVGSQHRPKSGSLCGLLGHVRWKLFYERRCSLGYHYLQSHRPGC